MGRLSVNKKMWRIPQQGMVKGVCAGIAYYLDIPVKWVRLVTVLVMIFGFFLFVALAYIILTFVLDPMPESAMHREHEPTNGELLDTVDAELAAGEQRMQEMERYVTSDTFTLRSRFRQL